MSPIRTRSNLSPFVDIEPFAPLSRAVVRSSVIGVPPDLMLPETCAELALVAAAFASASTRTGGFDASPFAFAVVPLLPHPARSAAVRTRPRAVARIVAASLSNTIATWKRRAPSTTWVSRSRISTARSTPMSASSARGSSIARASTSRVSRQRPSASARAASSCWAHSARTRLSAASSRSAAQVCTTSRTRSTTSAPPSQTSADAGAELIDETPRRGMFGLEVAFVHPDSVHGVLSEVVAVG